MDKARRRWSVLAPAALSPLALSIDVQAQQQGGGASGMTFFVTSVGTGGAGLFYCFAAD